MDSYLVLDSEKDPLTTTQTFNISTWLNEINSMITAAPIFDPNFYLLLKWILHAKNIYIIEFAIVSQPPSRVNFYRFYIHQRFESGFL